MADALASAKRSIHAACRDLGIDAETRHDLQLRITGKTSTRDMTAGDVRKMQAELRRQGWSPARKKRGAGGGRWRTKSPRADIRKIHVLWRLLAEAGVYQPGARALNAFINSTKFAAKYGHAERDVDMLPEDFAQDVIEALKVICRRNGVKVSR